eukprot:gb/GECG01013888.1/.p1 GENE.gb/GECG01013888.1/~~gb/GECG01013888.1/.p1  ORF type:complete len:128 (+),score=19.56 gb/GECG01013888.1/:1-384(+)
MSASSEQNSANSSGASSLPEVKMSREELSQLRVSDHFPRRVKACKQVADTFFSCFSSYSRQFNVGEKAEEPMPGDVQTGRHFDPLLNAKALSFCLDEMKVYDECMAKHMPKTKEAYRVPEAYRQQQN